jgi:hypothetical protein
MGRGGYSLLARRRRLGGWAGVAGVVLDAPSSRAGRIDCWSGAKAELDHVEPSE